MYNPQLETFITVAESGSFAKAADKLYISPTAVIKQINILESNLDIKLFNRTHRGLTLTAAGKSLTATLNILSVTRTNRWNAPKTPCRKKTATTF